MKIVIAIIVLLAIDLGIVSAIARAEGNFWYVYQDAGSRENHGVASGWMGSAKSLKFNSNWTINPKSGKSCIQIQYDTAKDSETAWAGIYWQIPPNNWGTAPGGGKDLSGFKKLTFWVRGVGYIDKFMVGGIQGLTGPGDSGEAYIECVELTDKWQKQEIDLKKTDLSNIIGPFGFAISADWNKGVVQLFLDEVRFE